MGPFPLLLGFSGISELCPLIFQVTTLVSSAFLIVKVILSEVGFFGLAGSCSVISQCCFIPSLGHSLWFLLLSTQLLTKGAFGYLLPIVSFVIAWLETWFLDFKVLTQEAEEERCEYFLLLSGRSWTNPTMLWQHLDLTFLEKGSPGWLGWEVPDSVLLWSTSPLQGKKIPDYKKHLLIEGRKMCQISQWLDPAARRAGNRAQLCMRESVWKQGGKCQAECWTPCP